MSLDQPMTERISQMAARFRGFLPVVVDVETGGFDAAGDALLEIAAVLLEIDESGWLRHKQTLAHHVQPFPGANIEQAALEVNRIDPYHPFRLAKPERDVLQSLFKEVRRELRESGCSRAVLVGHNAAFDLGFVNAAVARTQTKRNPFHPFSSFDTATLAGLAYGQTVLARAVEAAGLEWRRDDAHSAIYDAERTAELFCRIVNQWRALGGWPPRDGAC